MQPRNNPVLRTRVYIDGYNLYYGRLKKTIYKWLDVRMLIEQILANVPFELNGEPMAYRLVTPGIEYFTAPILEAFAKSEDSRSCQLYYHDALVGHAARRWLNQPCSHLDDRIPIVMCEHDDTAGELRRYMDLYANEFGV